MYSKSDLDSLVVWADERGYVVSFEFRGSNDICFESKSIEINKSLPLEDQVFILSHECGHILAKKKKFLPTESDNLLQFNIFRLREEYEAWDSAATILKNLEISFDKDRFQIFMSKSIKKYINAIYRNKKI